MTSNWLIHAGCGAVVAAVLALAAGCAAPPVQAMSNARQAVQAAKEAGAPAYAPRIYAEAKHWLDDAEFALKHWDYERASTSAGRAEQAARAAILAARKAQTPAPAARSAPAAASAPQPTRSEPRAPAFATD